MDLLDADIMEYEGMPDQREVGLMVRCKGSKNWRNNQRPRFAGFFRCAKII